MSGMLQFSMIQPTLAQAEPGGFGATEVLLLVIGLVVGAGLGVGLLRLFAGRTIAAARKQAEEIVRRSNEDAVTAAQKAQLEADKRILERKAQFEKETEGTRAEIREQEKRLVKREDTLDRKLDSLTTKEEQLEQATASLQKRETEMHKREQEVESILRQQRDQLLRITDLTLEDAKSLLLERVEDDVKDEAARMARRILDDAEHNAKDKAREVTINAIQRFAGETTAESTVRAIPIPSDDLKGRIIGREGRNIRAIEKATGADIIVDDTPGVIIVSCFDKVRQAIAAESLQKLVADGRVHPSRIEEVVESVQKDIEERIIKLGKDAVLEAKLRGIHPKVSEAMGRLHFRTSYGQNVLRHSIEVAFLCQMIADQLGLDGQVARRCGFLHDIGKSMDHEMEGGHPKIGMDFAKLHGEKEPILNAIGGHHADIPAISFYTPIVMAADAISGARPGARRESYEKYIQRLEQLQDIAQQHQGVTEAHAIQAGREVRVMVDAKLVSDDHAFQIARKIADQVSDEMTFPGEIRVTVLRETRAIEIAR
jgi:ribonuclease Y